MEDAVAQHFSWVGSKGKHKFRDLNVTTVIMDAVRSNKLFETTVSEVEGIIKKWLQYASCRLKLKEERSEKRAEATSAQHHRD
uniref:Uncharacterized protein n=1 Tax=Rhipicephalus appendiculatus TaxID=34631 RepID=A0A131YQN2_RHIAP